MTLKLHANFLYKDRKDTYSRKMAKGKLLKCKYNEGKVHKLNLVKCLSTISLFGAKKHFGTQYVYEHWTNLSFAWNHGEFLSYLHFVNRSKCLYIYTTKQTISLFFRLLCCICMLNSSNAHVVACTQRSIWVGNDAQRAIYANFLLFYDILKYF